MDNSFSSFIDHKQPKILSGYIGPNVQDNVIDWYSDGVVIAKNLLPDPIIGEYCSLHENSGVGLNGWAVGTPYMSVPGILDIACSHEIHNLLHSIFNHAMGLHLCLTGWVSTERNWHQDLYLNPPGIDQDYAAVWFALDDISPDSGPFQYVPRSHHWGAMTMEKVKSRLTREEQCSKDWPKYSERLLNDACEKFISYESLKATGNDDAIKSGFVEEFIAGKGDVLVWHSRLMHRGSKPKVSGTLRKALICHYSGVANRVKIDMPNVRQHGGAGYYFVL